jgi:hypothetical protein
MHMTSPQVWFSMQVMYWWRLSEVNDDSVNNVMDKLELNDDSNKIEAAVEQVETVRSQTNRIKNTTW